MSHFITLVVIEPGTRLVPTFDGKNIPSIIEDILAPFQENNMGDCPKEYLSFHDLEDEMLKEYEEGGQEKVEMPDGRLLLPWDDEFKPKDDKGEPVIFQRAEAPKELKRKTIPFKETYATFEDFAKDWHGREKRDETHNRYGYWENEPKLTGIICFGNEDQILQSVQDVETAKRILSNQERARGYSYNEALLHMQNMRSDTQPQTQATGSEKKMAYQGEIWAYLERLSVTPEAAKRIMSDLSETFDQNFDRSQSSDGGSKSDPLQQMQYDVRYGGRQYRAAHCGSTVPHKAHLIDVDITGGSKWDWFEIGGRWAGYFQLKKGCTGVQGKQYNMKNEYKKSAKADVCFNRDIDWERMRKEAAAEAKKKWEVVHKAWDGLPELESWDSIRERHGSENIEDARKEYWAQPRIKELQTKEIRDELGWLEEVERYQVPLERHVQRAMDSVGVSFALVKDGKWYERGRMGWWGMVSDEKDPETWDSMFRKMIDELPPDAIIAAVDMHI